MAGLGTDTADRFAGPSTANGIAGLKTTMGLVSRAGVIPLALSSTQWSNGEKRSRRGRDVERDRRRRARGCRRRRRGRPKPYRLHRVLKADALKGARLGIARDFLGQ